MRDSLFILSQYLLPHHGLSRIVGAIADSRVETIKNTFIRTFANRFNIDMTDALVEDPFAYESFNAFFTRALKPQARPVDNDPWVVVSPVDGAVSQCGNIEHGRIFQAKGHSFSLTELLGGDIDRAEPFQGGSFATIYLSPRDYHRIHMPAGGRLREMIHVPGRLFSVNPVTAENVPGLFARNERVVALFDSPNGPFAMVLVGAMIVASMETVWAGVVAPYKRHVHVTHYGEQAAIELAKGEEMGRFRLGSTVVMVHPKGQISWDEQLSAGSVVRMGERIAEVDH